MYPQCIIARSGWAPLRSGITETVLGAPLRVVSLSTEQAVRPDGASADKTTDNNEAYFAWTPLCGDSNPGLPAGYGEATVGRPPTDADVVVIVGLDAQDA